MSEISANPVIRTLRCRVKDRHAKVLVGLAREVNMVWNFDNELSHKHTQRTGKFLSAYDLHQYTAGATKEGLSLHSQTVQAVNEAFVTRRKQFKKTRLRWRVSGGTRRSLGWIPFKASAIAYKGGGIRYGLHIFNLWDSYGLPDYELGPGSFSEDARGRWYVNMTVKMAVKAKTIATESLGIDLGLRQFAGFSDEALENIEAPQFYRALEPSLAIAQRAGKQRRVRAIHAKIANRRKDHLHQLSTQLVKRYGAIFVGNVNAQALAKTSKAKSVLDAGWGAFRTMLRYKGESAGVWFDEVNEAFSTQTCSACNSRTGPKGQEGLGIREWLCPQCGTLHDRDRNAARNILALGHKRLAEGIIAASAR